MKLIPLRLARAKINQPKTNLISKFHNIWGLYFIELRQSLYLDWSVIYTKAGYYSQLKGW